MIYILDTVALVTALTVLHMTPKLWIISGCLLAGLRHLHHTNLNRSMLMHIIGWSSALSLLRWRHLLHPPLVGWKEVF